MIIIIIIIIIIVIVIIIVIIIIVVVVLFQETDDAFYIVELADILLKHKKWVSLLPRVEPFYGRYLNAPLSLMNIIKSLQILCNFLEMPCFIVSLSAQVIWSSILCPLMRMNFIEVSIGFSTVALIDLISADITHCYTQFKPFGNKTFCSRYFYII